MLLSVGVFHLAGMLAGRPREHGGTVSLHYSDLRASEACSERPTHRHMLEHADGRMIGIR